MALTKDPGPAEVSDVLIHSKWKEGSRAPDLSKLRHRTPRFPKALGTMLALVWRLTRDSMSWLCNIAEVSLMSVNDMMIELRMMTIEISCLLYQIENYPLRCLNLVG
jgi:hypothetical protein